MADLLPRYPIWEDAVDDGLVVIEEVDGQSVVRVTAEGLALLGQRDASERLA